MLRFLEGPTLKWLALVGLCALATVPVTAVPTVVQLINPASQQVTLGTPLTITTIADDEDGDIVNHNIDIQRPSEGGAPGLWNWQSSGADAWATGPEFVGVNGDGYHSEKTATFTFDRLGSWHVRAAASDGSWSHTSEVEINVVPANQAPLAAFDSLNGSDNHAIVHDIAPGGNITLTGWAADPDTGELAGTIRIKVNGNQIGTGNFTSDRPDVVNHFNRPDYLHSGWSFVFNIGGYTAGNYTVTVEVEDSFGGIANTAPFTFRVLANEAPMGALDMFNGSFDHVSVHNLRRSDTITVYGWAADPDTANPFSGTIELKVNGVTIATPSISHDREDVANNLGRPDFLTSGWTHTFNVAPYGPGTHVVNVKLTDSGGAWTMTDSFTFQVPPNAPPIGIFDSINSNIDHGPTHQIQFGQEIVLVGWAADPDTGTLNGSVQIRVDGSHYAYTSISIDRDSVVSVHNDPRYLRSGWEYRFNSTALTPGIHTVDAVITDDTGVPANLTGFTFNVVKVINVSLDLPPSQNLAVGAPLILRSVATASAGDMTLHYIDVQRPGDNVWNYESGGAFACGDPYQGPSTGASASTKEPIFHFDQTGVWHVRARAFDGTAWFSSLTVDINVTAGGSSGSVLVIREKTYNGGSGAQIVAQMPGGSPAEQIWTDANVVVQSGAHVTYAPTRTVRLRPGFRVNAGGVFNGKIGTGSIGASYTLMVENGSGDASGVTPGTILPIHADSPPTGQLFVRWEVVSGSPNFADPTNPNTDFVMGVRDAIVRAVFDVPNPNGHDDNDGISNGAEAKLGTNPQVDAIFVPADQLNFKINIPR